MDYAEWTDRQCVEALSDLRARRTARGIPPSRFVTKINKWGYEITVSDYRMIENAPLRGVEHVRKGILDAAEKAFDPMPEVHQSGSVRHATETLAHYRTTKGLTYEELADYITDGGYPITRDEYRAIEQGTTKYPNFAPIVLAAQCLGISGREMFPELEP